MTQGTVKTQGSELFFVNPLETDPILVKLECPTGISGLGGAADQIEDTCLDTTGDKSYVRGLGNPGQVSVPFNMIPRSVSQQELFTLKADGRVLAWVICLSESTTDPTVDTDGTVAVPTDRSSFEFNAYISDVNIDIATNAIVKGTLTLQRSGAVTPHWFTPA